MDFQLEPSRVHDARVLVPGDKSISHRAVVLGSIATGETRVSGFLRSEDCLATLRAYQRMGVGVEQHDANSLTITGVGLHGLQAPDNALDLGNSGTALRLMAGVMAGQAFSSELTGDTSLSARPMNRIIDPLTEMGAVIESDCDGTPPLEIRGGMRLRGINYTLPMASAQVKSCILLAGLYADGATSVAEPHVTRDHTERMLRTMAVSVETKDNRISLEGGQQPVGCPIQVPADLSSAAFVMLAASLAKNAEISIENVGINPTRTGVIDILLEMGADVTFENERTLGAEPVADIRVRSSPLEGRDIDPNKVSLAIDEFPVLFVAAALAVGETRFSGLAELRVKESDRIAAMATGLRNLGIMVDETEDGAVVRGGTLSGGTVESFGDHRIAMSLAIAGSVATGPVLVKDVQNVDTSFPGFASLMRSLGIAIVESQSA